MKVKVNIYSEKSMGAPLRTLIDPVIGEADTYEQISQLVETALINAETYLPAQEVVTQISTAGIHRYLDIVNLQVYLRKMGLVLLVTEISTDPVNINFESFFVEVVTPNLGMLPSSTTFYQENGEYDLLAIVNEIVDKYNLGDTMMIPESNIRTLCDTYNSMKDKGMPIFPLYLDSLANELVNYGIQIMYIYQG